MSHVGRRARGRAPALAVGVLSVALLAGCTGGGSADAPSSGATQPSRAPAATQVSYASTEVSGPGDLRMIAKVEGPYVTLSTDAGFEPRFWPGVNLGATVPGRAPGEVAPVREDYDRWLAGMGELGVRVIRIYTILRPAFYDAIDAYNSAHPDTPIYYIQGIWIPEERFYETQNLLDPQITREMRAEVRDVVTAVYGTGELPERLGHASGTYTTDTARWLLAYSPGIEWDPVATAETDKKNRKRVGDYEGTYVVTRGATPTEHWIASILDYLAGLEVKQGWSHPLTFTNWQTTDPLTHPNEPSDKEDMVSVDATHLRVTDAWPAGFFASYHAYPYYPEFMRYQPEYAAAEDAYAAYLADLKAYHGDQAVMVAEFGVPTSLGKAHNGPNGRDQGAHSEVEAAQMDADMMAAIRDAGFAGGILFEWADEWFKITWNTVDLETPADRRPLWTNPLTNEQHFGVLAAEPDTPVRLGDPSTWDGNAQTVAESDGPVRQVRVTHTPEYLYLNLVTAEPDSWKETPITVGLDTRPEGNAGLPGPDGVATDVDPEADVAVVVGPGEETRAYLAAWTDPTTVLYGAHYGYLPVDAADIEPGSGAWVEPTLILNRPLTLPQTGESKGVEMQELNPMKAGTEADDARTLVSAAGTQVEMRIPWTWLGYSDPSSQTMFTPQPDGSVTTQTNDAGIGIAVATPGQPLLTGTTYRWEPWNRVTFTERRKAGWDTLASAYASASAPTS